MARASYEEAIRLYLETSGDAELRKLVDSLGDVGDTADFQSNIARKAFDRLGQSIEDIAKIEAFAKVKQDLVATEQQLAQAQTGAQKLFATFNQGDKSNSGISRMQAQARKTVNDLSNSVERQRAELQRLRGELSRSGVDTNKLGSAQGNLRTRMAEAQASLASSVKSLQQYRGEQSKAAAEVPAANDRIAKSYGRIGGALAGLRALAAPILAFLTFRTAVDGIKNLAAVATGAEDARRALTEMYGSQEAGNSAYKQLAALAKRNGVAFDATLESAKKLKAFGLDPLEGSLQALIDQNAAAGGSQEDLSGKVLALGQAWAKQKLQGEEILQLVERGVPVWDLLEKSTGKNREQLQKLSEAGKLGRTVIAGLIEEIGRANAGAANRAMSGLSGLIAQVSASWLDFRQKVVAAGVGEYFKQQMQLLLNSTGGLDGLARKVSAAIISVVEGLKGLGATLAPFVAVIGNVTLGLARNAEALVFLAKAYAGVKLVDFYQSMARGALILQANAAALTATNAAATQTSGVFGKLGSTIKALPRAISIGVVALGVDSIIRDLSEIIRLRGELKEVESNIAVIEAGQRALSADQIRQAQEMQRIYAQYANTVIQSNEQIKGQSLAQAEAYEQQLLGAQSYFKGIIKEAVNSGQSVDANVTAAIVRVNKALEQTNAHLTVTADAARKASSAFTEFSAKAVDKYDQLISKGKTVKESIDGIFDGVDFTRTEGIQNAVGILDQLAARGAAAGKSVREELRAALVQVADADLPRLKAQADQAFGAASAGAKTLAEEVATINLARLGVDVEALKTGFTQVGRAAVDQFKAANEEIKGLGLTAEARARGIAQAFESAFQQASTKDELKALKLALQDAVNAGNLGFEDFKGSVEEVDARLAKLGGTGRKAGSDIASGAKAASQSFDSVGTSSKEASSEISKSSGEATEATKASTGAVFELIEGYGELSRVAQEAIAHAFGPSAYNGLTIGTGYGGSHPVNLVTEAIYKQRAAIQEEIGTIGEAVKAFDELGARRAELSQKYNMLGEGQIDALVQAEQNLDNLRKRRSDEQLRQQEEQRRADAARLQVAKDLERVEKEAAPASSTKADDGKIVIEFLPPSATQAGSFQKLFSDLIDLVAREAAPRVIQQIERSRSISSRKRIR